MIQNHPTKNLESIKLNVAIVTNYTSLKQKKQCKNYTKRTFSSRETKIQQKYQKIALKHGTEHLGENSHPNIKQNKLKKYFNSCILMAKKKKFNKTFYKGMEENMRIEEKQ